MTLRAKLLATVLTLVALALLVSDIASAAALRTYLLSELDKDLVDGRAAAARRIEGPVQTPANPVPPSDSTVATTIVPRHSIPRTNDQQLLNDFYVEIRRQDGTIDDRLQPSVQNDDDPLPDIPQSVVAANLDEGPFTVSAIDRPSFHYRAIAVSSTDGKTVLVAISLRDVNNAMRRLVWVEVFVTIGVLSSLGGFGWWIVRRELRPLEGMARTADAIAAGDLSQRVTPSNPKTEVGRLSEALNLMLTEIETSFDRRQATEERLRRFAADASHELRTPLTAIRGYAELYRQGAIMDEEHLTRVMSRIEKEATRMGLMVDDLLLLARMDQHRPVESERVDLHEIAQAVAADLRAISDDYVIAVDPTGDALTVDGDSARLHQVLANLAGNALHHTPPGTHITIATRPNGDDAEILVIDNGPGMSAEQAQRIFERFYRADEGRSRDTGGTGLGLAIVKSIVDMHDGSVVVETAPGAGSTFIVRLPRVK